jgi:hypothetical protein
MLRRILFALLLMLMRWLNQFLEWLRLRLLTDGFDLGSKKLKSSGTKHQNSYKVQTFKVQTCAGFV